jgi:hypothetical protein
MLCRWIRMSLHRGAGREELTDRHLNRNAIQVRLFYTTL